MNKKYALPILLFIVSFSIFSQSEKANVPSWISMMDDTTVNYYVAVEAFENFWQGKPLPIQEEYLFSEINKINFNNQSMSSNDYIYSYYYKKFKQWQHNIYPFVLEDGTILTPSERLKRWKENKK